MVGFSSFIPIELPPRHTGEFMGIAPTGKRVEIRYMDFWKVVDGKIADNWVMVDFPHVMNQGPDSIKKFWLDKSPELRGTQRKCSDMCN